MKKNNALKLLFFFFFLWILCRSPVGKIGRVRTELGTKPAPFMAEFSSRGPNIIEPAILKVHTHLAYFCHHIYFISSLPFNCNGTYNFLGLIFQPDITAPGLKIIAAYINAPPFEGVPFNTLSGTSMSCPHVAGLAGLLKTLHPDWSPSAIKSAIMTTGTVLKNPRSTSILIYLRCFTNFSLT